MWGEIKTNCQEGLFRTLKLRELWPQILRYNVEKASVTIGIRHIWQIWQPSNQKLPRDQCYPAWSSSPAWWRRGGRWGRYRTSQKYTWHVEKHCQRHNRPLDIENLNSIDCFNISFVITKPGQYLQQKGILEVVYKLPLKKLMYKSNSEDVKFIFSISNSINEAH